jgi:YjbR
MTIEFRKMALEIPSSVERSHMRHPDFRVAGKIFASLGVPNRDWGMVKLTPEQQRAFIEKAPQIFKPASGAWGRQGYTNVYLPSAKTNIVRAALDVAAKNVAKKKQKKTPNIRRRTSNSQ